MNPSVHPADEVAEKYKIVPDVDIKNAATNGTIFVSIGNTIIPIAIYVYSKNQ